VRRPLPSLLRRARAALLPADPARRATRVVLVGRGPAESRAFGNQEALMAALAHVASQRNLDFALFEGAATPMRETVDLFASAALVVGVHGAGLANCLFMAPGAAVLELALPESEFGEYAAMAAALGLAYAASPLPHSNFEARAWPRPSNVAAAAAALLDA
jgi:capsular polysaccharide biosynthesis protein